MERIVLAHGAGGVETSEILQRLIFSKVPPGLKKVEGGVGIDFPDDAAAIPVGDGYIVVTTDSYTVSPPYFSGGNIGTLAASGTINDVVMMGARPIAALDAIIVEEGFPVKTLEDIVESMISIFTKEGVALIGGDFKTMPKGQIDGVVITTVGIGISKGPVIVDKPREGDKIVVTDFVGDHGGVILANRLGLEANIISDVKPLTNLLPVLEKYRPYIHAARDPTRGGLAMVLNDWAKATDTVIVIDQGRVKVRDSTRAIADMAGIDPLYLASEGVAVLAVDTTVAEEVVEELKKAGFPEAYIAGEVRKSEKYRGIVLARTEVGGYRILETPRGELVPRIC
ncbi:hydrogenase expression/formation protein HypE [Pyrobaculum calidifontis]|uniref:Hydrogenase expression/formation protein HypE n=1 Tax=Pyrobaculum calidifontis (strain DSM 21063 / JCM 11548 / VA1) TaxID=410359 RepID=A3MWG9_PYRCJ|nr:hydrogenase expression/formation protein HypE [Pyrobaculum calidifontis]ABO08986.1 hydrogenase expression/formation protein HypE [Pyrobaculum calidifontis JCM 11548]